MSRKIVIIVTFLLSLFFQSHIFAGTGYWASKVHPRVSSPEYMLQGPNGSVQVPIDILKMATPAHPPIRPPRARIVIEGLGPAKGERRVSPPNYGPGPLDQNEFIAPDYLPTSFVGEWTCPASPYSQWFEDDPTTYPNRVVGRLFATHPRGYIRLCTACLVERNLVLTAAHCVVEGGRILSPMFFYPGYQYGAALSGWQVRLAYVPSTWQKEQDLQRDIAFLTLWPQDGSYPGDHHGWAGLEAMVELNEFNWYQYGYPANLGDGEIQSVVNSGYGHHEEEPLNKMIGVGSNMQAGASGGPWFHWTTEGLWANGLNSYGYLKGEHACDETMYSPYFNDFIWNFYQDITANQYP